MELVVDVYSIDANSININDVTLNDLMARLENSIAEKSIPFLKIDQQYLRLAAANFLGGERRLDSLTNKNELFELKKMIYNIDPEKGNVFSQYANMRKKSNEQIILQSKYLLAREFEKYLDSYRGKQKARKMVMVHEDNEHKQIRSYQVDFPDIVLYADKTGKINTTGLLDRLEADKNSYFLESDTKNKKQEDLIIAGNDAYFEVKDRLYNFYKKYGKQAGIPEGIGILMQKIGKNQHTARVLNKGDQKEAYVAFIMSDENPYKAPISTRNSNMHKFIQYYYNNYLSKITNLAAIIEEDVIAKNKELGVKGAGATLPSLAQYEQVAAQILSQEQPMSRGELEVALRSDKTLSKETERNIEFDAKGTSLKIVAQKLAEELKMKGKI